MVYAHHSHYERHHSAARVVAPRTSQAEKEHAALLEVAIMSDLAAIWQSRAREAYKHAGPFMAAGLQAELSARIQALTGRKVDPKTIYADAGSSKATTTVDGVTFRLNKNELVLVRSCSYCGTGEFESIAIVDLRTLGYALHEWHPHHKDCEESDPAEYLYNYDF